MTNYQAWLRGWMDDELQGMGYQPLVTISKEFWVPTDHQLELLEDEANDVRRGYLEHSMMADWTEQQTKLNATIKATYDTIKKQRDEIIDKGNESTRKNMMTKLMGQVLADTGIKRWESFAVDA